MAQAESGFLYFDYVFYFLLNWQQPEQRLFDLGNSLGVFTFGTVLGCQALRESRLCLCGPAF